MSKKSEDDLVVVNNPAPVEDQVSLDDFCLDTSRHDRRVTLLGGFHYLMTKQGKSAATRSEYESLYAQYLKTPV